MENLLRVTFEADTGSYEGDGIRRRGRREEGRRFRRRKVRRLSADSARMAWRFFQKKTLKPLLYTADDSRPHVLLLGLGLAGGLMVRSARRVSS